jgi:CRP/FNR family cyclic AMP-dependent transcriptional regulator
MNNMSNYAAHRLHKAGVSELGARSVASRLTFRHHEAQEVIWAKGSEVQSWQFIITGLVAAAAPTQDARSVPIIVYGAGSWFGEQPIFNRMPPHLEYVCLAPTQVLSRPAAMLWELFETEPGFARYSRHLAC